MRIQFLGDKPTTLSWAAYSAAGAVVGLIGWSGMPLLLPVCLLFPFLFGLTKWRSQAAVLSAAYFLAASSGLPKGAATYFQTDLWTGIALWLAASLTFVVLHTLAWQHAPRVRATAFIGATLIMALPPAGIVGWASPLTTAGILFPGTSWFGLAAVFILIYVLVRQQYRRAVLMTAGTFWVIGSQFGKPIEQPEQWTGLQTRFTYTSGSRDFQRSFELLQNAGSLIPKAKTSIVVLPEGAAGWRTPTAERSWKRLADQTGKVIYAGAEQPHKNGYDNLLVRVTSDTYHVVYRQRMPVPVSMWRPWSHQSAQAYFFLQPVVDLEGTPTAVLICYEQLLIWPILHSRIAGAQQIVGIANSWWARETTIPNIQRATMVSWARLFDMPLVTSFNL